MRWAVTVAMALAQRGERRALDEWCFFFSSRRRHTRLQGDWSSDVCSSDLDAGLRQSGPERVQALRRRMFRAVHANSTERLCFAAMRLLTFKRKLTADAVGCLQIGRASCRERV